MKRTRITLKVWAGDPAIKEKVQALARKGYKELGIPFDTIRGKKATEAVEIRAYRWHGEWAPPTNEVITLMYKTA